MGMRELGDLLGYDVPKMTYLMKRGVFRATFCDNRVWAVHSDDVAEVATRINCFYNKQPYRPAFAVTIEEAAQRLGITPNGVYLLRRQGQLKYAEDEVQNFIDRDSLEELLFLRGLKPRRTAAL